MPIESADSAHLFVADWNTPHMVRVPGFKTDACFAPATEIVTTEPGDRAEASFLQTL